MLILQCRITVIATFTVNAPCQSLAEDARGRKDGANPSWVLQYKHTCLGRSHNKFNFLKNVRKRILSFFTAMICQTVTMNHELVITGYPREKYWNTLPVFKF